MTEPFGVRLRAALADRGPLCVGIDPHPALLSAWGLTDDPTGLDRFTGVVLDALADRVAVFKPQSAFFERLGAAGVAVLERVVARARAAGALVLLDVKRGDIGSTMAAYAHAYLDPASPLGADAVTASPYLGVGALQPMVETALATGGGVFVLALTSNPEGASVQRAVSTGGRSVAQSIVDSVAALNAATGPPGSIGVVVGATIGTVGLDLTALGGPVLVPGLGAQGGTAADLRRLFGPGSVLLPSMSREILRYGPAPAALRAAAERASQEVREALG